MEGSEVRGKGYFCLRFAHCHNGLSLGPLRVYVRVSNGRRQTWWSLAKNFGPRWHTAAVQLDLTSVTEVGVLYARYMTCMSPGKSTGLITRTHAHAHTLTHTHVHTPAQINVHASTYACTYVCKYTHMHTYT